MDRMEQPVEIMDRMEHWVEVMNCKQSVEGIPEVPLPANLLSSPPIAMLVPDERVGTSSMDARQLVRYDIC